LRKDLNFNNHTEVNLLGEHNMALRINTNPQSLAAQRNLSDTRRTQQKSLEKLSSGERINRAADDAAGLAISEKLKAEIRSSNQANRNANDAISIVQTAEGGLSEVSNILIRLRELSVQSASDTINDSDRKFTDLEFANLIDEVDRISGSTKFNGLELLNGQGGSLDFQVGTNNDEFNDRINYDSGSINASKGYLGIEGLSVATKDDARNNLEKIDAAIDNVNSSRSTLGALQNRLGSTITNLEVKVENLSSANSRIRDTDVASETAKLTQANILAASGTSVLSQSNEIGTTALKLIA